MRSKQEFGKIGEIETKKKLSILDDQFVQLHSVDLDLDRGSQHAQLDHLLIGTKGIIVVETKNWVADEISFTNPGVEVKKRGIVIPPVEGEDITSQVDHQINVVRHLLNKYGMPQLEKHVDGIICFVYPNSKLNNANPKYKAIKLDQLNDVIASNYNRDVLTQKEVIKIVNSVIEHGNKSVQESIIKKQIIGNNVEMQLDEEIQNKQYHIDDYEDQIFEFCCGLAAAKMKDGKVGFIDSSTEVSIAPRFDEVSKFSEGLAKVLIGNQFGYINTDGETVIKFNFEEAQSFSNGFAGVKFKGAWGFIDKDGKVMGNIEYDSVTPFNDRGESQVAKGQRTYTINKSGREVGARHLVPFDMPNNQLDIPRFLRNRPVRV